MMTLSIRTHLCYVVVQLIHSYKKRKRLVLQDLSEVEVFNFRKDEHSRRSHSERRGIPELPVECW